MRLHEAPDKRKTELRPFAVKPEWGCLFKFLENSCAIRLRDPHSFVANLEHTIVAVATSGNHDPRSLGTELVRIREEAEYDLVEATGITSRDQFVAGFLPIHPENGGRSR